MIKLEKLRIRLSLATALALSLFGALNAKCEEVKGISGSVPREVLAFYYGWYGTPAISRQWIHWKEVDAQSKTVKNTADYPTFGVYDSHDQSVLKQQTSAAKTAGFTGLISSWWGKGDFTDRSLSLLLDAAWHNHLHISALVEKLPIGNDTDAENARVEQLEYLVRQYGSHPAWLRVKGRPVIFLFGGAYSSGPEEIAKLLDRVRRDMKPQPIFLGDMALGHELDPRKFAVSMDGLFGYNVRGVRIGMTLSDDLEIARANYSKWLSPSVRSMITCLTVTPGYDDSHLADRPKPRPIALRRDGSYYSELWNLAISDKPDWVLVTSWNEWHEGTEIESSNQYNDKYLRLTPALSAHFLKSQPNNH